MKKFLPIFVAFIMIFTFFSAGMTANATLVSDGGVHTVTGAGYTYVFGGSATETLTITSWDSGGYDAIAAEIAAALDGGGTGPFPGIDSDGVKSSISYLVFGSGITAVSTVFSGPKLTTVTFNTNTPPTIAAGSFTGLPGSGVVKAPASSTGYDAVLAMFPSGWTLSGPTTTVPTAAPPTVYPSTGFGSYNPVKPNLVDNSLLGTITGVSSKSFVSLKIKGAVGTEATISKDLYKVGGKNDVDTYINLDKKFLDTLRKGSYTITAAFTGNNVAQLTLDVDWSYKIVQEGTIFVKSPASSAGFGKYTAGKECKVEIDAPRADFQNIKTNGKALTEGVDYTVGSSANGGTIITLTEAYLKTVGSKKVTFDVEFKDYANGPVKSIPLNGTGSSGSGNNNNTPKAGDDFSVSLWIMLCGAAAVGLAATGRKALRKVRAR